jgi:hypothetical protein
MSTSSRNAIPHTDPLAKAEFATVRKRLIKIGARVIEHLARIRIQLPISCPVGALFRAVALHLHYPADKQRASRPDVPPARQITPNALHCELRHTGPLGPAGGARTLRGRAKMAPGHAYPS